MENYLEVLKAVWPLLLLSLTLLVWALADLIKREKPRFLPKWAWFLIVLLVSTVGPILYLALGRE